MPSQCPDPQAHLSHPRRQPLPESASNGLRPAHGAMAKVSVAENEVNLDAPLEAARHHWATQKGRTKASRGRVRQVARERRHRRLREITETFCKAMASIAVYSLIIAGLAAFGVTLTFFAVGNVPAGLTLCTVAAAAWGLAGVLRR
ncbi:MULTISPECIES: hypothetical protein [unclassified Streptomyces]|uniref:hypothetical protein n=1 Tax=unclassified Streptomyces TaxID=2593676 RepID=UPI000B0E0852|nr:hypothetical protein [Streptomyces sp. Root1310]